jgi:hypothetical protein
LPVREKLTSVDMNFPHLRLSPFSFFLGFNLKDEAIQNLAELHERKKLQLAVAFAVFRSALPGTSTAS